jgi:hypothetical protein
MSLHWALSINASTVKLKNTKERVKGGLQC